MSFISMLKRKKEAAATSSDTIELSALLNKKRNVAADIMGFSLDKTNKVLIKKAFAPLPNKPLPLDLPDLLVESADRVGTDLIRIKLKTGQCFYGHRSEQKEYLLYYFFKDIIPKEITGDAFKLALDIQIRYFNHYAKQPLPPYMPKGGTFLECGCYTGLRALRWHDLNEGDCNIVAVEIGKPNYDIMKMNIEANNAEKSITPVHAGLYREDGEMEQLHSFTTRRFLTKTDRWEKYACNKEKVRVLTVDTLLNQNNIDVADFMNLQVNGAEIDVLQGFKDLNRIKVIYVAAYYGKDGVRNVDVVKQLMESRGCDVLSQSGAGSITFVTPKWKSSVRK